MDTFGRQVIQFLTKAMIIIFCIGFGALVIFSSEPFKSIENAPQSKIEETNHQ